MGKETMVGIAFQDETTKEIRVNDYGDQDKRLKMQTIAAFTPLTITVETLQILAKHKKNADLIALYMSYVEISTWQHTQSVKASSGFMMKRLSWGKDRFHFAKTTLVNLGLVVDRQNRDATSGKTTGHYVLVKHIVNHPTFSPEGGFDERVDFRDTSTTNLQLSTTNEQKSAVSQISKDSDVSFGANVGGVDVPAAEDPAAKNTRLMEYLISIINPREKVTEVRMRVLRGRLKEYTHKEIALAGQVFAQSEWHKQNKQMSIDNLLAPSKFGRWYSQIEQVDGIVETDDERRERERLERKARQEKQMKRNQELMDAGI